MDMLDICFFGTCILFIYAMWLGMGGGKKFK